MRVSPHTQEEFEQRVQSSLAFSKGPLQTGTINAGLDMQFVSCDLEHYSLVIAMDIKTWMYNPAGSTLHGGISAALADHALGTLVYALNDCEFTPTVSLALNYLTPVRIDRRLLIECTLCSNGGRLATATARAYSEGCEDLAYTATGTFYLIRRES